MARPVVLLRSSASVSVGALAWGMVNRTELETAVVTPDTTAVAVTVYVAPDVSPSNGTLVVG